MNKQPILKLTIAAVVIAVFNIVVAMYSAEARPSTKSYTCSGLKSLIRDHGSIVMNHKNRSLYQKFVHSRRYCRRPYNTTKRFRVPTKTGACYVRICYERRPFND
ncbi:MAG: hypothetical protein ABJM29_04815 [Rhizobiaceae bacterium]